MLQRLDFLCSTFDVYTDCNLLTYIKNTCKGNATGQRKINELTDYNFIIHYKTRVENVDADPLSRLLIRDTKDLKTYSQLCCADEVKAIFVGVCNQSCNRKTWLNKVNVVYDNMENEENEI